MSKSTLKFPLKVEVETVASGNKEVRTIPKDAFPKGSRTDSKAVEYLGMCFREPNFRWKFAE